MLLFGVMSTNRDKMFELVEFTELPATCVGALTLLPIVGVVMVALLFDRGKTFDTAFGMLE